MADLTPAALAERRKALGLTLSELGELLGVDRGSIYRWEHGKRAIPPLLGRALETLETARAEAIAIVGSPPPIDPPASA